MSGSLFGPLGEAIVIVGDAEHHFLRRLVAHLIREGACFFCATAPVLGIVDEGVRHGSLVSEPTVAVSKLSASIGPISAVSQGQETRNEACAPHLAAFVIFD